MSQYKNVSAMKQSICGYQINQILIDYASEANELAEQLVKCKTFDEVNKVADSLNALKQKLSNCSESIEDKFLDENQKKTFKTKADEILDFVCNLLR